MKGGAMREGHEDVGEPPKVSGTPCPVLINAKAGALRQTAGPEQMLEAARAAGIAITVVPTRSPEETRRLLRQLVAEGAERVAVAGGDGTVSLAVQELAHTQTALGILPQGTANNFATALRLPMALPAALRVLADGVIRSVDLGKVAVGRGRPDRYFTESSGVGLFADALAIYGKANKSIFRTAYAILTLTLSLRARRVRLFADGELHAEQAVLCEVANSFRMAYALPVAPAAKVTDGLLDVVVVGDLHRRELIPYYRAFRAQTHAILEKVTMLRAREVRIESRHRMNVHADDRVVGATPVVITAQPGALRVLVDRL